MIRDLIRKYSHAQQGNVAIIFSLSILPMIGIIGLGVDISRTIAARTSLQAAADAAALGAVTTALNTLQSTNTSMNSTSNAITSGQAAGANIFNANAAKVMQWTGQTITPTVTVPTPSGNIVTATVTYSAGIPTIFGKTFKVNSFSISGNAKSSLSLPRYMNITVLIDNSESMGFAASPSDIANLENLTYNSKSTNKYCAFGCHVLGSSGSNGTQVGNTNYETLAHNNGITLRTDVIQTGVQNMIAAAQNLGYANPLISFTLYTFNKTLSAPLGGLSQSTNYPALINAAGGIDIDQNPASGGETSESAILQQFAATLPTSGDGSTAAKAQQFIFLMTDGVDDINASRASQCSNLTTFNSTYGGCFGPADCTPLLNSGKATVGVIYTTYIDEPGIALWDNIVKPFSGKIASAMQNCASSNWFYQATQASDINNAINQLFSKAVNAGVLIQ